MANLSLKQMPLKNLKAHPVRSVILLVLAAAQAACVFGGASLATSSYDELSLAEQRLGADVLVYPGGAAFSIDMDKLVMQGTPVASYADRATLKRMDDCEGIEAVSCQIYLPGPEGGPSWVIGYEPERDFALAPWIEEGRDFDPPSGTLLVGCDVAVENDAVEIFGRSWPVGAHLEKTGSELDGAVFASLADLHTVIADATANGHPEYATVDPATDYSAVLVRVSDKSNIESVTNWINVYVRKVKAVQSDAALTATASGISWQAMTVAAVAISAWVVLLAALAVAQSMSMRERRSELYVWRASGASRKVIARTLRREALLVHTAGAVIGVILSALVTLLVLPGKTMPLLAIIIAALAAIALSALVGWVSASISASKTTDVLDNQMLVAA